MDEGSFADEIADHLALKARNSHLERTMPLADYLDPACSTEESMDRAFHHSRVVEVPRETTSNVLAADPDSWWESRMETSEFNWGG
jgi:hypothetical protein